MKKVEMATTKPPVIETKKRAVVIIPSKYQKLYESFMNDPFTLKKLVIEEFYPWLEFLGDFRIYDVRESINPADEYYPVETENIKTILVIPTKFIQIMKFFNADLFDAKVACRDELIPYFDRIGHLKPGSYYIEFNAATWNYIADEIFVIPYGLVNKLTHNDLERMYTDIETFGKNELIDCPIAAKRNVGNRLPIAAWNIAAFISRTKDIINQLNLAVKKAEEKGEKHRIKISRYIYKFMEWTQIKLNETSDFVEFYY
jgi:hypothetical protein